jgi:preprotein translocase subunit SecE
VNLPAFADFLIAVEAEMYKVSWPSWTELVRWSMVVIIMIFSIAFLLFGFDLVWTTIFQWIHVLPVSTPKQ